MRKGIALFSLAILLIPLIGFTGCIGSETDTPTQPLVTATDTQQNNRLNSIETRLTATEAKATTNEGNINSIGTAEVTQAELDAVSSQLSTAKTELDTAEAKIVVLEAKVAELETGTGNGSTPSTGEVTVTVSNAPGAIVYNEGTYTWWIEVANGYSEWKRVYIGAILTGVHTITGDIVTFDNDYASPIGTYIHSNYFAVTGNDKGIFSMNYVPNVTPGTISTDCTLIGGNSQGYLIVQGGDTKVIPITLELDYNTGSTQWEMSWSCTEVNYP